MAEKLFSLTKEIKNKPNLKKAISATIGSVLLVVFTIAIASLAYIWLKDYTLNMSKQASQT